MRRIMSGLGKALLMAALVLIAPGPRALRSLVEAALHNEWRLLQAGIRRTEQRLQAFETQYGMSSAACVQRYENEAVQETLDVAEWVGEYRLRERWREKSDPLQPIHMAA